MGEVPGGVVAVGGGVLAEGGEHDAVLEGEGAESEGLEELGCWGAIREGGAGGGGLGGGEVGDLGGGVREEDERGGERTYPFGRLVLDIWMARHLVVVLLYCLRRRVLRMVAVGYMTRRLRQCTSERRMKA
jgi:hypothetical protein